VLLRRATPQDHAPVGELTVAAYAEFLTGPADGYAEHLCDAAGRDREAELWVAQDDGVLLGTVTVCPEGSAWRELAAPGEGEFRMLAVDPAARRRGVGQALVNLCLERFHTTGDSGVVISSLREMTAAHRIYQRAGFHRVPALDWDPVPGVHLIAYRTVFEGWRGVTTLGDD